MITTKNGGENAFLGCPVKFCDFRSEILTSYIRIWTACANKPKSRPFFIYLFLDKSWSLLYLFGSLFRSNLSDKRKKKAGFQLVGAWWRSCQNFAPKYVKLSETWPIHRSGGGLAGPARRCTGWQYNREETGEEPRQSNMLWLSAMVSYSPLWSSGDILGTSPGFLHRYGSSGGYYGYCCLLLSNNIAHRSLSQGSPLPSINYLVSNLSLKVSSWW